MVYLDANVFVFAALEAGELGNAARHILANLPKVKAKTCCLTLDELAWAVMHRSNIRTAVEACRAALALPGLDIVSVEYADVWRMTREMEEFGLRPRGALHLAVMRRLGEKSLISDDLHFDKTNVKRISIEVFARKLKS